MILDRSGVPDALKDAAASGTHHELQPTDLNSPFRL
jgi:hypothetical protein